jgi:argininosuccinate lyase
MIKSLKFKPDAIRISTLKGYLTATDIADYLVKKGVSFREAHSITGKLVSFAVGIGKNLHELDLTSISSFHRYSTKMFL